MVHNPLVSAEDVGSIPGSRRYLEEGPTPVLPGESHQERRLAGYSPRGRKGVGHNFVTKQQLNTHTHPYMCVCMYVCVCAKSPQSCPTLCDPVDCSLPGSSVCGILQARIPEWVAIPFSKGSSPLRDTTRVSCVVGGFFTISHQGSYYGTSQPTKRQRLAKGKSEPQTVFLQLPVPWH